MGADSEGSFAGEDSVKDRASESFTRWETVFLCVAFAAIFATQLRRLTGPLDEPSWRQAWCAVHAREVGRTWPTRWFANYINFRGNRTVSYWTLPLYETVVGLAYRAAGRECLVLARAITLLCFLWATTALFAVIRTGFGRRVAWFSALAFWMQPLNLFYSRAVHYEMLLVALWLTFFFYAIEFARRPSAVYWMGAASCAAIGAWIKPTFVLWTALPVLAYSCSLSSGKIFRRLIPIAFLFTVPFMVAMLNHAFRLRFEGNMPNTPLYADPYNALYARSWFLGDWVERLNWQYWWTVIHSIVWVGATPAGIVLALVAPFAGHLREKRAGWLLLVAWALGLLVYTVAFLRLIAGHDYWRIPYGPWLAMMAGISVDGLTSLSWFQRWRAVVLLGTMALLAVGIGPGLRRGPYFQRDEQRIRAGEAIRSSTPPQSLVLSTAIGRTTGPTDPRILYFADRRGWANRIEDLSPELMRRYREAGADFVAVLVTPEHLPLFPRWEWMINCAAEERPLRDAAGRSIGSLFLYTLKDCQL